MVVTTPKSIRNSLDPSVYLAQDNSEIRYKCLVKRAQRARQTVHHNLNRHCYQRDLCINCEPYANDGTTSCSPLTKSTKHTLLCCEGQQGV